MKPTSFDYASVIRMYAYKKFGVALGKTQVLKLLYMLYGMYLSQTGNKLFEDDEIRAWTFGPVCPNVYYRFNQDAPYKVDDDIVAEICKDKTASQLIINIVTKRCRWSAIQLVRWTHEYNSPWYKTVYGENGSKPASVWGGVISDDDIKKYFENFKLA